VHCRVQCVGKKLNNVMAVTEAPYQFWQIIVAWANPKVWEMAMKKNLIPSVIVLLLVGWFALDAVAAILV
jgi:hypothetical protein